MQRRVGILAGDDGAGRGASGRADACRPCAGIPADEHGGAVDNGLQNAAVFASNELIALNWSAIPKSRDNPAGKAFFGTGTGPVVWETFRSGIDVYPGTGGSVTPHGDAGGYNDPPTTSTTGRK
jgi:hypothetical protein